MCFNRSKSTQKGDRGERFYQETVVNGQSTHMQINAYNVENVLSVEEEPMGSRLTADASDSRVAPGCVRPIITLTQTLRIRAHQFRTVLEKSFISYFRMSTMSAKTPLLC